MLHIILFTILGTLLALFIIRNRCVKGKSIPGPCGLPFIGCFLDLKPDNTHEKFFDYANIFGEIFQVKILKFNIVVLNTGELIRTTSADPYKEYLNYRPETFYGEKILFGSQSTSFHKEGYSVAHNNLRKGYSRTLSQFGQCSERSILDLVHGDLMREIELYNGEEFEITSKIKRSLTKLLSYTLTGEVFNTDESELAVYWEYTNMVNVLINPRVNNVLTSFPFLQNIPGPYASYVKAIVKAKENIVKVFRQQKESYAHGIIRGFVDCYLEQQYEDIEKGKDVFFTDEIIICQMLEFCASVMLITWGTIINTFLCLVKNPEYQDKIFEELNRLGKDLSYKDKAACPFFEAVEMEVHRYVTGFPLLLPRKNNTPLQFEGYHLPKGSIVIGNIWHIHHDEKIWGDPWNFRPERWLDDSGNLVSSDHIFRKNWFPFGHGRRKCVGEQFARIRYFLYVSSLIRRWKFIESPGSCRSCDPRDHSQFDINVTLQTKPFYCRVEERN